jgi:hypothetical protein
VQRNVLPQESVPTVQETACAISPSGAHTSIPDRIAALWHDIEHGSHLLPAQGPITVVILHNTQHAFEHLPFVY